MHLNRFRNSQFNRGAGVFCEALWMATSYLIFSTGIPGSFWRRWLLRFFGAKVGRGVIIKPYVKVKFPWRLKIGDSSWIGEGVWIDNLEDVNIAHHVCISQGAYLCTGSHNWSTDTFDLITKSILVGPHSWIAAFTRLAPGVNVGEGAVLGFASVAIGDLDPWTINAGCPAKFIRSRVIGEKS